MDRPGVRQVPEGGGEQGKMQKTGCKIICGAQTTLAVKGLMMTMIDDDDDDFIRCPFHSRVTAVARKRPRSFCPKYRWQVTPKHAYAHDPTKSEWADYAAVQA